MPLTATERLVDAAATRQRQPQVLPLVGNRLVVPVDAGQMTKLSVLGLALDKCGPSGNPRTTSIIVIRLWINNIKEGGNCLPFSSSRHHAQVKSSPWLEVLSNHFLA